MPADRLSDWPASRRRGDRWRSVRWLRVSVAVLCALLVVAAVPQLRRVVVGVTAQAILLAASPTAPDIHGFAALHQQTQVVAADGTLLAELSSGGRRTPIAVASLPDHVKRAVLAAEDVHFYEHRGVDGTAVFRALLRTVRGRKQGGSTITQQLAKINYTDGERTFLRKLREVQYVTKLESRYTKDELLERYLNQVYFGEQAYGIDAAARTFFGVDATALTVAQAATLAGKIRSPERLDPRSRPDLVLERRKQVLSKMKGERWLTEAEYSAAVDEPLALAPRLVAAAPRAPHFVELVKREAQGIAALGADPTTRATRLFSGGYRIETTMDLVVHDATVDAVRATLGEPGDPTVAVASVEPGTGAIRSIFGGLDFDSTQFDVSSLGVRQPGSAFKPFVYLAALRAGIDPRSTFDGRSPRTIGCYGDRPVQNYAGEDAGAHVDLDRAMVVSANTVFVDVGCRVGVPAVLDAARDSGVPRDATKAQGAVFLGGLDRGVSALTMAAAYATFAAGGTYAEPFSIARIRGPDGTIVYERKPSTHTAFRPEEVGVLNAALLRVVEEGTGKAAAIDRPVAGKTGTTQDNIDAWFAGYAGQLSTAVWTGFEPKQPMSSVHGRSVTGGSFPAQIFASLMRRSLAGRPIVAIPTASPDSLGLRLVNTTRPVPATSTTSPAAASATSSPLPPPPPTEPRPRPPQTAAPTTAASTAKPTTTTTVSTKPTNKPTTSAPGTSKR